MKRLLMLFIIIPIIFTSSCVSLEKERPDTSMAPSGTPDSTAKPSVETAAGPGEAINITDKKDLNQATTDVTPVIIVPGIMGSELVYNGNYIWMPFPEIDKDLESLSQLELLTYTNKIINSLNYMQFSDNAVSQYAVSPVQLSPVGTIIQDRSYNIGAENTFFALAETLSLYFGSNNVFFFGYDWRTNVMDSGTKLSEYIDYVCKATGQDKVHIIAHSMGGLVTTAYLMQAKEIKADKVITAGTPFGGADKATAILLGGDLNDFITDYLEGYDVNVDKIEEAATFMSALSNLLLGLAKSYPSLYTLTPAKSEVLLFSHKTTAAQYGLGDRKSLNDNYKTAWSKVTHYNIVGTGHDAISFDITDSDTHQGKADGDGTVTKESATYGGLFDDITKEFVMTHTGLISNEECVCYIVELLDSKS